MLAATTKLEAINVMLASIGADPIDFIDEENDVDVANALRLLDKTSKFIQKKGWDFNKTSITIQGNLDDSNRILWDNTWVDWKSSDTVLVKRGDYVFDFTNQTFFFTSPITVTVTFAVDFEDLPECFREYVSLKAAYDFQTIFMGDGEISQDLAMNLQMSERDIVRYDMNMSSVNMLQVTGVAGILGRS